MWLSTCVRIDSTYCKGIYIPIIYQVVLILITMDIHIIVHLQYMKTLLVFITYSMKKAFFEEFPVWKLGISRSSYIVLPWAVFKLQKSRNPRWPPGAILNLKVKVNSKLKIGTLSEFPTLKLVILYSSHVARQHLVFELQKRRIPRWPPGSRLTQNWKLVF